MAKLSDTDIEGVLSLASNGDNINDVLSELRRLNTNIEKLINQNKIYKYSISFKPFASDNSGNIMSLYAIRIKNMVFLSIYGQFSSAGNKSFTFSEVTLPEGFRPNNVIRLSVATVANNNIFDTMSYSVDDSGKLSCVINNTGYLERRGSMCYYTDEEYPTDNYIVEQE